MATVAKKGGASGAAVGWTGELQHTPLAEVLRRIVLEERSGDLRVTSPSAIKTVYFDRGFVVFATSNLKTDSLGERLIEAGRISQHEFALVSMLMKSGKRTFRESLVQAGIVPEEELGRHVGAQVNKIVLSLFSVREGTYSFEERSCIIPVELMVSLSAHRILIEGVRRMSSGKLILAGLPPLDTKIRLVPEPPFTLDVEKLRPVESAALRSARKGTSIRGILGKVGGDKGKVLRACYALYAAGVIEPATTEARGRPRRVQEETGTFVLSEILQKIGPTPEVGSAAATPAEPDVPTQAWEADSPPIPDEARPSPEEPATPPEIARQRGQGLWTRALSLLAAVVAPLSSLLSGVRESSSAKHRAAATETEDYEPHALTPREGEERETPELSRASSEPEASEDESSTESLGVPSWSVMDDPSDTTIEPSLASPEEARPEPRGEEPVVENLGVPSWSIKDAASQAEESSPSSYEDAGPEPREQDPLIESLGAPAWSIKDDADDSWEESAVSHEEKELIPEETELELEEDEPEIVIKIEDDPAPVAVPTDSPFDTSDGELLIELDPDDDSRSSMLNPIPVEEVELEEDNPDLVIVIEQEAFEDAPDTAEDPSLSSLDELEPVKDLSLPSVDELEPADDLSPLSGDELERAVDLSPLSVEQSDAGPAKTAGQTEEHRQAADVTAAAASSAPAPVPHRDREEEVAASATAQAMRVRQLNEEGGEARLLRDVKLHFKVRDWKGAVGLLEQLLEISPENALYRGMLGRAMSSLPNTRNQAEKHFIEALRLSPQAPELHYWLGLYYKSFGLKSRAYQQFRTTLRIDPKHAGARRQLSVGGKKNDRLGGAFKKLFG
jgi:tetratricopeptide (TPR) repeat protein